MIGEAAFRRTSRTVGAGSVGMMVVRLLIAVVTTVTAWLIAAVPGQVALAEPSHVSPVFVYDGHGDAADPADINTERGPPAAYDRAVFLAAVGRAPGGASARPSTAATASITTYDHPTGFAQPAQATGTTQEEVQVNHGALTLPARSDVAANSADEFVDLASASRRSHILDGEVRPNGSFGGGHRPGTGFPNKSEFPAGWSDDKIMHSISDVATDPSLIWRAGNKPGDFFVNGTRGGIDIEVLIRNNQIWTGYPTNVIRNAP